MTKTAKKYLITLTIISILILISTGIFAIRWGFYNGYIRFNNPSFYSFPIHGIDISHHQGQINWNKLDRQHVQFIFIKATEGGDFRDTHFQNYWQEANQRNIPISVYHFFTFCRSGKEQAQHFINEVPTESITMLPAVDLEFGGNCKANRRQNILTDLNDYIQTIENHYQKKVIIYATQDFYQTHLINQFPNNPIWIRDIYKHPNLPDRPWLFWQYANRGRLKGIKGFVDLNVFAGSKADFHKFLTQQPAKI